MRIEPNDRAVIAALTLLALSIFALLFFHNQTFNITLVATVVIAAFTVTQAIASMLLARLTKQSGEFSREALLQLNRASIVVSEIRYNWQTLPDDLEGDIASFTFRPIWGNTGNTATSNMMTSVGCELLDTPLPEDFEFNRAPTTPFPALIGPKVFIAGGSARTISVDEMEEVVNGKKFLYVWGWASYRDVFPETPIHVTRYCIQIVASGNVRSRPKADKPSYWIVPAIHPRGNCADDECRIQGIG